MTSTVTTLTASNATDAAFRAWGQAVSNALQAAGLVLTSDTGQINWSTVTRPTAANTAQGYEIYRFSDSLQATKPVYLKLEYGSNGTTNDPNIWITVGTATTGTGAITTMAGLPGSSSTRRSIMPANSSDVASGGNGPFYCNGDTSAVFIHLFGQSSVSANWGGGGFLVERTRDPDGTAAGRGFTVWVWSNGQNSGGSLGAQSFVFDPAIAQPTGGPASVYGTGFPTSVVEGSAVYPLPVFTGVSPRLNAPSKFLTLAGRTDVPLGTQYAMTHYGASGTWVSGGAGNSATSTGYGTWTGVANALNSPQFRV